jgi:hypothetical protein
MEYRLYFLDSTDHIRSVAPFVANTDEIAIEVAERLTRGKPLEMWNRDRLVMRRSPEKSKRD